MREFVILRCYSSIATPSHQPQHHQHRHYHSTKPYRSSLPNPKLPPPSPPIPSLHSPSPLRSARRGVPLRYYADLASKLAGRGRLEEFAMIVESETFSAANTAKFVSALSAELVAEGILTGLREGNVRTVIEVLSRVKKLRVAPFKLFDGSSTALLGIECRRLVECGEVEEFVELMEVLAGFRLPIKEILEPSDIIRVFVDKRTPNLAIRYACILPHAHIFFCTIIHEFGKKGDLVSALKAYEASKQNLSGPNMYVYRTIMDVCGLCGDYMKSRYIYENLGVTADMASYNILLKACCLAGRVDLAQDIYEEVRQLESTGVLKLDVFTYSTIVKVFADAKLWQMALHIKEDMLSTGVAPNLVAWSSLIRACANAGLIEKAIVLFEEMLLAGCEPNAQCCNILLHACVEDCQYDRAFRLFHSWKGSRVSETTNGDYNRDTHTNLSVEHMNTNCSTRVPSCVTNSHHSNYFKKFPFTPTTATYNILMKACGTDYYRAKALMDEMKAVGLSPNHISWSILMDICGGIGNVDGAIQILRNMLAYGSQPDVVAYTTAIKVCVERKSLKLAFLLFEEMKNNQIRPNLVTYNTILRARSRYGSLWEVQQCLSIYQDMRKAGYKSNDYYLETLIEEWCEGVIQEEEENQGECNSCSKTKIGRSRSVLEKIAIHLQKSNAESLSLDLQGLTKVEARIVVLAVLRMIKENYLTYGHSVKDDIFIILGVSKVDTDPTKHNSEVKHAMIKLLRNELELEVLLVGPRNAHYESDLELEELVGRDRLPSELECSTRGPAVVQRLKVTRSSLLGWLQRRVDSIRR